MILNTEKSLSEEKLMIEDKAANLGSPFLNFFKRPVKIYLIILASLILVFGLGFSAYAYFSDPVISIKGQGSLKDEELKITIGEEEIKVQNNKIKLNKNQLGKEISLEHPDYKPKKISFKKEIASIFNPTINLEPVDFTQVIINFKTDKEKIERGLEKVLLNGVNLKPSNENNKVFNSEKITFDEQDLNIDLPDFTPITKKFKPHFGRNEFTFDLENNWHQTFKITDFLTNKPLEDVKLSSTENKTDTEGKILVNHLENLQNISFEKDGYNLNKIEVKQEIPERIELVPTGRIAYPKSSGKSDTPISVDLYSANYDGSDEKQISPEAKVAYQFSNEVYYIKGNIGVDSEFSIFKANLTTNQSELVEKYKNNIRIGEGEFKSISVNLGAKAMYITQDDYSRSFPSYNKFWLKKLQDSKEILVRDRKFPKGNSETMDCCNLSPDNSVVSYSLRKYKSTNKGTEITFNVKVVGTGDGKVLYDRDFGKDTYPFIYFLAPGNKYGLLGYSGKNVTSRINKLVNFETKAEKDIPENYRVVDMVENGENQITFSKKEGDKTSFFRYDAQTDKTDIFFEAENVKNYVVLNKQLYVRIEKQWNIVAGGKAKPVSLKPNFPFLQYFWGDFTGFATGWGPGEVPEEMKEALY